MRFTAAVVIIIIIVLARLGYCGYFFTGLEKHSPKIGSHFVCLPPQWQQIICVLIIPIWPIHTQKVTHTEQSRL